MLELLRVGAGHGFSHALQVALPLPGQHQTLQISLGGGENAAGLGVEKRAKRFAELEKATGQRSQHGSVMVGRFGVCLVGRARVVHRTEESLRTTPAVVKQVLPFVCRKCEKVELRSRRGPLEHGEILVLFRGQTLRFRELSPDCIAQRNHQDGSSVRVNVETQRRSGKPGA